MNLPIIFHLKLIRARPRRMHRQLRMLLFLLFEFLKLLVYVRLLPGLQISHLKSGSSEVLILIITRDLALPSGIDIFVYFFDRERLLHLDFLTLDGASDLR